MSRFATISGYFAAVASAIVATLSAVFVQGLQGSVPDIELSAVRGLLQGPMYLIVGKLMGWDLRLNQKHIPPVIYLSLVYIAYNVGYYGSTVYLPLTEAVGFFSIFTIISAVVQSKLMYREEIKKIHLLSLSICIVGTIMLVQPAFVFRNGKQISISPFGYILSCAGGIAFGMTLHINAISLHEVAPFVKITYFTSLYFIFSILLSFYLESPVFHMDLKQFLFVIGHAITAAISTFCNIYAAHTIGGVRVSIIYILQILFCLLMQYTLMKDIMPGNMNWIEVFGAVVLAVGVIISPALDLIQMYKNSDSLP